MPPTREELRWVEEPVQARAPRIDASEWAKHKNVIIREFKQAGLPHTIKFMKQEYNFIAEYSSLTQKLGLSLNSSRKHHYKYQLYTNWRHDWQSEEGSETGDMVDIEEDIRQEDIRQLPHIDQLNDSANPIEISEIQHPVDVSEESPLHSHRHPQWHRPQAAVGQPPKRRGPKPDSKLALTRRQELARQAQKTHCERKETYIKDLEDGVHCIEEAIKDCAKERDTYKAEVRCLKALLAAHGIQYALNNSDHQYSSGSLRLGDCSTFLDRLREPMPTGFTSLLNRPSPPLLGARGNEGGPSFDVPQIQPFVPQPMNKQGLDYDQIGVDFVLTHDRTPYLSPPPGQ